MKCTDNILPLFAYRPPYGRYFHKDMETLGFMCEAGIDYISISPMNTINSIGDQYSNHPLIWKWFDTYDFNVLDRQINEILAVHPKASFICTVDLNAPIWLARQLQTDSFYDLSNISLHEEWKDQTTKYLIAFLDYCEMKYPDRMIAYVIACGRTLEWIESDNGKSGTLKDAYYHQWCHAHEMENMAIPSYNDICNSSYDFIRDPDAEKHIIQWMRYVNSLTADLAINFISVARKHIRSKIKLGMFFGHITDLRNSGHSDCERVFDTAPPDFIIGAACNSAPAIGWGSGHIATLKMLERRGIAYFHECDRITSESNLKMSELVSLSGGIWDAWKSPEEDIAGLKREMGLAMINRFSIWWFNIWGNSYKNNEVRKCIANMHKTWKKYASLSTGSNAEILLVYDPESNYFVNTYDHKRQYQLGHGIRRSLAQAGLAYDTAAWADLIETDLTQYRMIVFQNLTVVDAIREAFLKRHVFRNGRTIVWNFAPGIISNGRYMESNVENICGIKFGTLGCSVMEYAHHRSIYVKEPLELTAELFLRLSRESGMHQYCDECAVWSSKEFVMIHSGSGGTRTIRLPVMARKVVEVFSGRLVVENNSVFTETFKTPDTRLYFYTKTKKEAFK